jgi:hypothetical protein
MASDMLRIRGLIATMIAVGLACRLAFVFLTPIFQAPDEEEHLNYIRKLAKEKAFPVMAGMVGDAAKDWEYGQPPLYYLLLAPVYGAARTAGLTLEATVHLLRLSSVILWAANLWLCSVLLRRLQVSDSFTWIFVMGMVSLLPTYVFISSAINNDNLMTTLGGALFCLLATRKASFMHLLGLGLLLGLALLTKKTAIVFFPAVILLPALNAWRARSGWLSAAAQAAIPMAIALVIFAPWAWRDWHLYGTLQPESVAAPRKDWPSPVYGIASAVHNLVKTFWAVSGINNNIGYPLPLPGQALLLLAFVPMRWWPNAKLQEPVFSEATRTVWLVFSLVAGINILLVLRYGCLLGMGQGRHLFAVLFPIALLLATRLRFLPFARLESLAAGFWVVYAAAFTAFSLVKFG